ncbi:tenascin-X-like isoform X1 [Rhinopithecus roxellana]|uniref:tenascin-X-like isoform X1 n=1 Tax=Rhinopithecus roxellana TaxID=61622 RepID=UPI0012372719|nr:tenascin-X-like isoform X1 [Rhinopithecus roxellana]
MVQYEDTNGQPQALLVDGDQSKILISGLEPSTPYRFLLYGLHEGKRLGPLSAEGTTGDPAPGRGHISPAPWPLSLHPLQCTAPGHVGREPPAARVHLFHHRYLDARAGAGDWVGSHGLRLGPWTLLSSPQVGCGSPSPGTAGRRCRTEPVPPGPPPSSSTATASGPSTCFVTWRLTGAAGWWVALGNPGVCAGQGLLPREPEADGAPTFFPGVPAPHGWTDRLLEGLGGLCPWFWEHLWGVLAGSVPHRGWGSTDGDGGPVDTRTLMRSCLPPPGNEALHRLKQAGDCSMRVDLRAGDEAVFAQYDSFRVDSTAEYYRLHLEGYHGTAGDSMSYHSGSVFSARDRDPKNLLISCTVSYRGAWWYRNCHYANLNGLYGSTVDHQGVSWYYWKGFEFSVPFTEMKLRPRNFRSPAGGG